MSAPLIDPAFLSDPRDLDLTKRAVGVVREVFGQSAFAGVIGEERAPGPDADLEHFIRTTGASGHHICGSARMGPDRDSVVDCELRVHGVEGLRIADASVMPTMVSGNTNATTIMIGERAADFIRGQRLPPEHPEHRMAKAHDATLS